MLVLAACGGGDDSTSQVTQSAGASTDPASDHRHDPAPLVHRRLRPGLPRGVREDLPEHHARDLGDGLATRRPIAKLQAGFEADVVNSCVDEATLEMVQKGIYVPLDVSRLEHWDDLFPSMTALPGVQVDGQVYMLPVDAGTSGIVYDADVVTTPPDSWSDLFDPQWAGRAAIEDIAVTGHDDRRARERHRRPDQHGRRRRSTQVKQYLIDHKSQFRTFWKGDAAVKSLFKSGEIVISSGYPGQREGAPEGRRERAVRRGERGPVPVGVRLRHHARRRPREPRCGLRAAELLHEPRGRSCTRRSTGTTRWRTRPPSTSRPTR